MNHPRAMISSALVFAVTLTLALIAPVSSSEETAPVSSINSKLTTNISQNPSFHSQSASHPKVPVSPPGRHKRDSLHSAQATEIDESGSGFSDDVTKALQYLEQLQLRQGEGLQEGQPQESEQQDLYPIDKSGDVSFSDNFSEESEEQKRNRLFVGKRARLFVGKRSRLFVGKRPRLFVGKRRLFVGKRPHLFVGKRRLFVGKRPADELEEKRTRLFVGKRNRLFVGKRNRLFVGKRNRLFVGKRNRLFVGKRDRLFVGKRQAEEDFLEDDTDDVSEEASMLGAKRSQPTQHTFTGTREEYLQLLQRLRAMVGKRTRLFVGKRGGWSKFWFPESDSKRTRLFVGKRSGTADDTDSLEDVFNKRARLFVGKRGDLYSELMSEAGKRARLFVGKRDLMLSNSPVNDKRARLFVGKREDLYNDEDKRARLFVGKREDPLEDLENNDKRARLFVGKREDSLEDFENNDKRARLFVGKREDPLEDFENNDKRARLFVGKREDSLVDFENNDKRARLFVGKREDPLEDFDNNDKRARLFVGRRGDASAKFDADDKRTRLFVGRRSDGLEFKDMQPIDKERFVGGRIDNMQDWLPKQEHWSQSFVGTGNYPEGWAPSMKNVESNQREIETAEGNGEPSWPGQEMEVRNNDDEETADVLGAKRARLFVGKRARLFVGKRSGDSPAVAAEDDEDDDSSVDSKR